MKHQLLWAGTVAIATVLAPATPFPAPTVTAAAATVEPGTPTFPVYAHRGGTSRLVEDTRANYLRAAARGSLWWETDVRFSRTNYPVLLHDADLRRFGCPSVRIATVSVARARRCVAANGQTLSTLHEFVSALSAHRARAMIELKTVPTKAQWAILQTRLEPVKSRIVIQSFRPAALVAASRRGYRTAFLTRTAVTVGGLPTGTDWYAPKWTVLTAARVRAMHAAGVKVVVWTPACAKWAGLPAGVDAVISNDLPRDCS
jgi:glycerophosphoryl diester phosphodiesterase